MARPSAERAEPDRPTETSAPSRPSDSTATSLAIPGDTRTALPPRGRPVRAHSLLNLQRRVGNAAVSSRFGATTSVQRVDDDTESPSEETTAEAREEGASAPPPPPDPSQPDASQPDAELADVSPDVMSSFEDNPHGRNFGATDPGAEGMTGRDPDADIGRPFRGEVGQVVRRPGEMDRFEIDGRAEVAAQDMFVVRLGGARPGGWGYYPFRTQDEAAAFAMDLAARYNEDPSSLRQELALPDAWATPRGPFAARRPFIGVFRLPRGHPFIVSQVAPQPEGADVAAGEAPRTYRGGGLQVQFTREAGLDPTPLHLFPVRETTADDMTSDPPRRTDPASTVGIRQILSVGEPATEDVAGSEGGETEAEPSTSATAATGAATATAEGTASETADETAEVEEEAAPEPTTEHELGTFQPTLPTEPGAEGAEGPTTTGGMRTTVETASGEENIRTQYGRTTTSTGEFLEDITTETQFGGQIGRGGAELSGSRTRTVDYGGGVSTRTSHGGSIDAEGRAGYSYSRRSGREGEQTTTTVGGSAQLGDTGIEGATVTAGRSTEDGRSVTFSSGSSTGSEMSTV